MERKVYNTYSDYLQKHYGVKVYKLPIKLDLTCPNRDGNIAYGGCSFCGAEGGSFGNLCSSMEIKDQLLKNKDYIGSRYNAEKFIAYFQNFTNTYMEIEDFKSVVKDAIIDEDIVGISISTRPDTINEEQLEFLKKLQKEKNIDITVELGLQSVNYKSLIKINRGHTLAEYIDASLMLKKYNLRNCTHLILNLPWDDMTDAIEAAKIISALEVEEVKLHSLYIVKDTKIAEEYENKKFEMIDKEEYINRVIEFLRHLSPDIIVQRLLARAEEGKILFENWGISWWAIRDEIVKIMLDKGYRQGDKFNYLKGKAFRRL